MKKSIADFHWGGVMIKCLISTVLVTTIAFSLLVGVFAPSSPFVAEATQTFLTPNTNVPIPINFVNGSFETPLLSAGYQFYPQANVPGWKTRPSNPADAANSQAYYIEIQRPNGGAGFATNVADGGKQYAELNAYVPGTLYQNCNTVPDSRIYYEFYHAARAFNSTTAQGAASTDVMNFYLRATGDTSGGLQQVCSDYAAPGKTTVWGHYTGSYTVPDNQTSTEFSFESVSTTANDLASGNYLDGIRLYTNSFLQVTKSDNTNGTAKPGDTVTYTINVTNAGECDASQTILTDVLPAGVDFVPNSIQINGVSAGTLGTYDSTTGTVRVNLGGNATSGSSPSNGGLIKGTDSYSADCNNSYTVTFQVNVTGIGVNNGSILQNQARVDYNDRDHETDVKSTTDTNAQSQYLYWNVSPVESFTVQDVPTATPSPSPVPTAAPTATPSPSPSPSPTKAPTATPSPSPTATPTATPSPSPSPTPSPLTVTYTNKGSDSGTPPTDSTKYPYSGSGKATALPNTDLVKAGYTLTGWTDGTNTYAIGSDIPVTGNITLDPVWAANLNVTYTDKGSDSGTPPTDPIEYSYDGSDNATVLPNTDLVKAGYTLTGWTDGTNTYAIGEEIPVVGDITLDPVWTATVTYDANGGTGAVPTDGTIYSEGETATVLDNTEGLIESGYTFVGWNTEADGSGTSYAAGEELTISGNVTLYAQWAKNFTVTYTDKDADSGTPPTDPIEYSYDGSDSATVLPNTDLTKAGYTLTGWTDGTNTYTIGEEIPVVGDITLDPVWINDFTVTYTNTGADSGTPPVDPLYYAIDGSDSATALPNTDLTKAGYTLTGWQDQDGNTYAVGDNIPVTGNITLDPVWAANLNVTYTDNGADSGTPPTDPIEYAYDGTDSATVLPNTDLTKDGYTLTGWQDQDGNTYAVGDNIPVTGDITLDPIWTANPTPTPVPTDHTTTTLNDNQTKPLSSVTSSPNFKFKNPDDVIDHTGYNQPFDGIYTDPITGVDTPTTIYVDVIPEGNTTTTITPASPKPVSSITPPPNFQFKNPDDVVSSIGENGPYDAIYTDPNTGVQYDTVIWIDATPALITDDHFAYMQGYPGGYFNPEGSMTRAEAAAMFTRLMTKNAAIPKAKGLFPDVQPGVWYADAIEYLVNAGIMTGRDATCFDPDVPITRAEFAAVASRFDNLTSGSVTFSDVPSNFWAYSAINSAAAKGWVTGYTDGTFRPLANIRRSEVVTLVNRMLSRHFDNTFTGAGLIKYTDVPTNYWAYSDIEEASNSHDFNLVNGTEFWTGLTSVDIKY